MLRIVCAFVILTTLSCQSGSREASYKAEIISHRKEINTEFLDPKHSPLLDEDRKQFTSLNFFPIDSMYRFKANVTHFNNKEPFQMATSTERLPWYQHVATLTFAVNDTTQLLEVYKNLDNKEDSVLFIPFGDATNGLASYGGGRYLDIELEKGSSYAIIDFNKAYNPYCAYNHRYSCPIPPEANRLEVAIKAGEKVFKHY